MAKGRFKNKYKIIIGAIVSIGCLIGIIYSVFKILNWKENVEDNQNIKEQIEDNNIIATDEDEEDASYDIDFNSLKEQNTDTIAYLKVNGTCIDYIVVKGYNNSYYLNHNFNKEYNIAGWIFADYHNTFDNTDRNIIIYGHNMEDGSMFGTLQSILYKDWYGNTDNHKVILVTEQGQYEYKVFSTYSIEAEDYYINTQFYNNDEFNKFVNILKSRSIYDYGTEVSGEDKILTLSSCIGDGTMRVVLHAKLIESE